MVRPTGVEMNFTTKFAIRVCGPRFGCPSEAFATLGRLPCEPLALSFTTHVAIVAPKAKLLWCTCFAFICLCVV